VNKEKSLTELKDYLTSLPRGGYLLDGADAYLQFGAPPETIKDTIFLPKGVPQKIVLLDKLFDVDRCISLAEIEFPIYYNFFIKKRKMEIFATKEQISQLEKMLQESLFGPKAISIAEEYGNLDRKLIPKLEREIGFFRNELTLDKVVEFFPIDSREFSVGKTKIQADYQKKTFHIREEGRTPVDVPFTMNLKPLYDLGSVRNEPFQPPEFGVTCLGPSHGFDPEQNTSGFILWINKTGVMVDPPVNSTSWLLDSNVNPKLIDTIILTHCHADHDAGTFQKILQEGKVNVYSTPTVMQSFLRKYSAVTNIPESHLYHLFTFIPIKMDVQYNIHGALFQFFYTIHSIPTIGFHFAYRDKTFLYSSDHYNDPNGQQLLVDKGIISEERKAFFRNLFTDIDIIYHEAGIPPLHTPVAYLNSLPPQTQKKITVYHIAEKDFPKETNLTLAKFGIGETLYPEIKKYKYEDAYQILDTVSRIDIFKELPADRIKNLLLIVKEEEFEKGEKIISKGTPGDKFYIIRSGNVTVGAVAAITDKIYGTFDYFGEVSLVMDTVRTADVVAATHVFAYSIEKDSFMRLIRFTPVIDRIIAIANSRNAETWEIIRANPLFQNLSSTQITNLEEILHQVKITKQTTLIRKGKHLERIYILQEGLITISDSSGKRQISAKGSLVGDLVSLKSRAKSEQQIDVAAGSLLYAIEAEDMDHFIQENPAIFITILLEQQSRGN
jgi:CRP-like cAMP-binding protein